MTRRPTPLRKTRAAATVLVLGVSVASAQAATIVDHNHSRLLDIPTTWIQQAKQTLHIAYGHTSHGSQLVTGMTAVQQQYGSLYAFAPYGAGGALDLRDTPFSGASDLGNPDRTSWASATRSYLNAHPETNVIVWSWCGQVDTSEANIDLYLSLMNQLETEYPSVKFVYMTGHLNGTGTTGNVNLRNEQIRTYCRNNGKILFDFADIESYDPDRAVNYMALWANDNCDYDSDGNGSRESNWATNWTAAHPSDELTLTGNRICSSCCAHSQPLNCVQKAGSVWWLWARLAGWAGADVPGVSVSDATVTEGQSGSTPATFTVSVTPAPATTATVTYTTADGTANAGSDYTATSGTLTFNPGTTQLGVAVPVLGDTIAEPDETFRFVLTGATNATVVDAEGLGLIVNDDAAVGTGFHPLPPCRVVDTRTAAGGPALAGGATRNLTVGGTCGVPTSARAVSLNVTVTQATAAGHLRVYASGQALPNSSVINFQAQQTRANNCLAPVGTGAVLAVYAGLSTGATVHLIVDVTGFYD
jgi:hypothetical protein